MSPSSPRTSPNPKLRLFGREFPLPRSRAARIAIGVLLIAGGVLGFLPVLGFWMLPLGFVVLSYEFATVRRWRRRLAVWWRKRQLAREGKARAGQTST